MAPYGASEVVQSTVRSSEAGSKGIVKGILKVVLAVLTCLSHTAEGAELSRIEMRAGSR